MSSNVELIPGIMDSKERNMPTGAALMRRWFAGAANNDPKNLYDTQIVKMNWVLKFPRAKEKYDALIQGRMWNTEKARDEIIAMLSRKGLFTAKEEEFGNEAWFKQPANQLDPDYIQMVSIQSSPFMIATRLDDMDAALANFDLRMVVGGSVRPVSYRPTQTGATQQSSQSYAAGKGETLASVAGRHGLTVGELIVANPGLCNPSGGKGSTDVSGMELNIPNGKFEKTKTADGTGRLCAAYVYRVKISRVGVYVRDSYDFNDEDSFGMSQPLGLWEIGESSLGEVPEIGILGMRVPRTKVTVNYRVPVFNSTFRDWRAQHGRGADFLVFSDVKMTDVRPADEFDLKYPTDVTAAVARVDQRKAQRANK